MEVNRSEPNGINSEMDSFEEINVPPLPSAFQIVFRCRDCDYRWKLEMELPALLAVFYRQNIKCYSCRNSNIEMDIISKTEK